MPNEACKRMPSYSLILVSLFLIIFPGCYETDFDFKTVLYEDGSLSRETRIDGRGARLFIIPAEESWEAKAWETRGEETFIPNTYYHVLAYGHFKPDQEIPSDYEFDLAKQKEQWGEATGVKLREAGFKPPFEDSIYSRNRIQVKLVKSWLSQTFIYEEVFKNAGLIDLLIADIESEIKKDFSNPIEDKDKVRSLAKERLEAEILSRIQFRNELLMPGKIVSSNAKTRKGNLLIWQFSLNDFEKDYSEFTLRAVSRLPRFPVMAVMIFGGVIFLIFAILIISGVREVYKRRRKKK